MTASPFYRHSEGWCTCTGGGEVVVFSPNCGGAVVEHCRKYTVGYDAWRGSRPGCRRRPYGDRAGVLAAPAGGVVVPVESNVPRIRRGGAPSVSQAGSCPSQGRGRFRGPCPCCSRVPRRGKHEGSMGSWQHSGWSSAEHVSHSIASSHSGTAASGMAEQCPELADGTPITATVGSGGLTSSDPGAVE